MADRHRFVPLTVDDEGRTLCGLPQLERPRPAWERELAHGFRLLGLGQEFALSELLAP